MRWWWARGWASWSSSGRVDLADERRAAGTHEGRSELFAVHLRPIKTGVVYTCESVQSKEDLMSETSMHPAPTSITVQHPDGPAMADTGSVTTCCVATAQVDCCAPEERSGCCGAPVASGTCGCQA